MVAEMNAKPIDEAVQRRGLTRCAPLMMPSAPPRSSPARSASVVLRAAGWKAKVGAAARAEGLLDHARTRRAGLSGTRPGWSAGRDSHPGLVHRPPAPDPCRGRRAATTQAWYRNGTFESLQRNCASAAQNSPSDCGATSSPRWAVASNPSCIANTRCSVIQPCEGLARSRRPASTHRSRRSSARQSHA